MASPLPEPGTAAGAAGLAALLADPAGALVALDFDGTLAPIVPHPADARPATGALPALDRLASAVGTLALLTGRPAREAAELAGLADVRGLRRVVVLGQYGTERLDLSTGSFTEAAAPPGVAALRGELPGLLASLGVPGDAIEDKGRALAVHTRRLADPEAAFDRIRGPLAQAAEQHRLAAVPGRLVVELRAADADKGVALERFARERAARVVLFAGDDLGDLPAYDAVDRLRAAGVPGLTVFSESAEVSALRERADVVVAGPAGVVELLDALATAAGAR